MGIARTIGIILTAALPLVALPGPSVEARDARGAALVAQSLRLDAQLPSWAAARWTSLSSTRSLALSPRLNPFLQRGDFDGDRRPDLALMVEHTVSRKIGIVFLHRAGGTGHVVGAGTDFGNGGDDFDWVDQWEVEARGPNAKSEQLLVTKESSASAIIYFDGTRYRWRQRGD